MRRLCGAGGNSPAILQGSLIELLSPWGFAATIAGIKTTESPEEPTRRFYTADPYPLVKTELSSPRAFCSLFRMLTQDPALSAGSQSCAPHPAGGLFPAASLIPSADKGVLASLEQKLKEIDEECRVEERKRVDLELNIVEVKDNLKKAEAGPVTLGTTVDTTHLENVSPRVSGGSRSSAPPAGSPGAELGGVGHMSCPWLRPRSPLTATAQSCHPHPCPRLYPSQLCNSAQEQASFGHGHGQRHRPPESEGKRSHPASFGPTRERQNCR